MPTPSPLLLDYVINGIEGCPRIVRALLRSATPEDYGRRLARDRFTLKEALAHWADWDAIHLERIERILAEDRPTLMGVDEGQVAIERDYAHQDVESIMARFETDRAKLVARLRAVQPHEWSRTATRDPLGEFDLFQQVAIVSGHDGYHLRQVVDTLAS